MGARVEQVQQGTQLIADEGFTCLQEGKVSTVAKDLHGLYIPCREGKHYLSGQLTNDGREYAGLNLAPRSEPNVTTRALDDVALGRACDDVVGYIAGANCLGPRQLRSTLRQHGFAIVPLEVTRQKVDP